MVSDNKIHKEEILTTQFINWFQLNREYEELYEDVRTSGDPFDSAGYIGDRLILIEFKNSISKSMVNYQGSIGSSIERKISQVLNEVYQQKNTPIYNAIKQRYNEYEIPTLIIVANRISEEALKIMKEMMVQRCDEWRFNYEIIIWDGKKPKEEFKGRCKIVHNLKNQTISVPSFPSTASKRTNYLNTNEVSNILDAKNLNELWIDFQHFAKEMKFKVTYQASNVGFINPATNHTIMGIWPTKSSKVKGLRISFSLEQLNQVNPSIKSFTDLGIERSKSKLGFLGYNGFIANMDELQKLKNRIKEAH